jgi:competence ComEA-like helix-hairpin-helix protein
MNLLRRIFDRFSLTRHESVALLAVFGLYFVGLTWRHVQSTTVKYDEQFYARLDSVTNDLALDAALWQQTAQGDTIPKPRRDSASASPDSLLSTRESFSSNPKMDTGRLNVNLATERQLTLLPGIGPALASRIVLHRQQEGPFRATSDLLKVRGIGRKTLARFEGMIVVE